MKEQVLEVLKGLGIPELATVEELCEFPGAYVNMESKLPDGTIGKILEDEQKYWCCQVAINDEECYGVAADQNRVVVYRYRNDDTASEVIRMVDLSK